MHHPAIRFRVWLGRLLLLATASMVLTGMAAAQQTPAVISAEDLRALLQRLQDLENQVATLKAQVQSITEKAGAPAPEAQPIPEQVSIEATPMPGHTAESGGIPRLRLRGYADVGWSASDLKGSTNSFALGQFNLFITSRLTDKASFLSETIIEADHDTNNFGIDLERMELIYAVNDHLTFQFGRFHTGIGYYNTSYHHSTFIQNALGRPFLFQFEDSGGILPVHTVGISATGTLSSKLGLHYIAEIGNGRNPRAGVNPVQNVTDDNNGKAFNLGFFMRPDSAPGLQFGFSNYHDHITPPAGVNVTENILVGHVIYQKGRLEFLNEAVLLRHTPAGGAPSINTPGFYSQVSRSWGRYRPYFRYEYVNIPARDPLLADIALLHGPKAGVRYELNEFAAFKIEYERTLRRSLDAVNSVRTQLSFAF
ncbi:MAG TPA: hypothetical protein VNW97_00825 [Candidatus Saccharimonadales bacterium]|jgi:hypothetical protein|nr:hypothetical protein [Candidatus Saccharimonadales bacterium]